MSAYDPYRSRKPQPRREVPKQYGNGQLTGILLAYLGTIVKEAATLDKERGGSPETWAWSFLVVFAIVFFLIQFNS